MVSAPALSPTRPPNEFTLWVVGWGRGLARHLIRRHASSLEDFDAKMRSQELLRSTQNVGRPRGFDGDGKTEDVKRYVFYAIKDRAAMFFSEGPSEAKFRSSPPMNRFTGVTQRTSFTNTVLSKASQRTLACPEERNDLNIRANQRPRISFLQSAVLVEVLERRCDDWGCMRRGEKIMRIMSAIVLS